MLARIFTPFRCLLIRNVSSTRHVSRFPHDSDPEDGTRGGKNYITAHDIESINDELEALFGTTPMAHNDHIPTATASSQGTQGLGVQNGPLSHQEVVQGIAEYNSEMQEVFGHADGSTAQAESSHEHSHVEGVGVRRQLSAQEVEEESREFNQELQDVFGGGDGFE